MRGILWFRNDIRLTDNETLVRACQECKEVIPVYILDERWLETDSWGHRKIGSIRLNFILEGLMDLKNQFQIEKGDLLFYIGKPEEILPNLVTEYKAKRIYASKAYATEEINVEEALRDEVSVTFYHTSTLIHPDDLPYTIEKIPGIFTEFRKKIEKNSTIRYPFPRPEKIKTPPLEDTPIPTIENMGCKTITTDPRSVLLFEGGETQAWKRLHHYFWETEALKNYKFTRNRLFGANYSSKLSPWLAQGNISARSIYEEIIKFEKSVKKNISTYWMFFELLWRDYFAFIAMKYGNRIFLKGGIKNKVKHYVEEYYALLHKWKNGSTGDSFVDANMRELMITGYMSNRGRQNVASYLVHDLNIDWRAGASWFESQLIDYDPYSNYGNWMYNAGIGNDPRENRQFNTKFQKDKYDPKGEYIALWLKRN